MAKKEDDKILAGAEGSQEAVQAPEAQAPTLRKYREKIKARYPDEDPQSEDDWMKLEDRYAEEVEGSLGQYKDSEMTLQEVMTAFPEFAQMLYDIVANKMSPRAAIAKHYSQEDLIPQEGDDDYEAYQTAYSEKLDKGKRRQELDKQIDANQDASINTIDEFCEEQGMSEDEKTALLDMINSTFQKMLEKIIDKPMLQGYLKMMTYEKDIASAAEAARIEGKNEAIEIKKAKDAESVAGDGVPQPVRGGEIRPEQKKSFFDGVGKRKGI